MRQSGHVYFFSGTGELEEELQRRRDRCRRVDSNAGHVSIETVNVHQVHTNHGFAFITRLRASGQYGYGQLDVGDAQLIELVDVVKKYLELPKQPIEVKVLLEQPRPRRLKRRLSPAAALEEASIVALDPAERAIHRRMLEGK